ncbi:DUF4919 domain-containing protein [Ningiella sp. W23]|uniref:DUF4919 domain-containing protein n=1 Tax=Ningiella sp. W23 TaxID=3023715 RepID=UPI0037581FB4
MNASISIFITCNLILLLAACATNGKRQESANTVRYEAFIDKADKTYLSLKQTIENRLGDDTSFDRLLWVYPLSSFYKPHSQVQQDRSNQIRGYMQNNQFDDCITLAASVLEKNYSSLDAHYAMAWCARNAIEVSSVSPQDNETLASKSRFHSYVLNELIEAIWRTGDGRSAQTAFRINSSQDLFAFVQFHQLILQDQRLVYFENRPIQQITVQTPENGSLSYWYFDVSPQFRHGLMQ